jgi:hypothetical protein
MLRTGTVDVLPSVVASGHLLVICRRLAANAFMKRPACTLEMHATIPQLIEGMLASAAQSMKQKVVTRGPSALTAK